MKKYLVMLITLLSCMGAVRAEAVYYSLNDMKEQYRESATAHPEIDEACYDNSLFKGINENGNVLILASCGGVQKLFVYSQGQWSNVTQGLTFDYQNVAMNNLGHVAFLTWGTGRGIYIFDGTQPNLVITESMLTDGDTFGGRGIAINDLDEIAFTGGQTSGSYSWNNLYIYSNSIATKLTHTSYFHIYSVGKINNNGKIACTQNWGMPNPGRDDIMVYDGSVVTNLTNLPAFSSAAISGYNNADLLLYRVSDSSSSRTFLYNGTISTEVTRDGESFGLFGDLNDDGLIFSVTPELLLCDGVTCEDILNDLPPGTLYSNGDLHNSEDIFIEAQGPEFYRGIPQPFAITSLTSSQMTETSALITWDTEVPASAQVEFGTEYSLGSATTVDPALSTSHSVLLEGLLPYTKYYFRAVSVDGSSNETVSSVQSFSTLDSTVPVTSADLTGTLGLNGWHITNVDVNLTATDAVSGVKEIYFSINGGYLYKAIGSSALIALSTEGVYSIAFYAIDNAGNIEATNTIEVKIDKTSPGQPVNISPADREREVPYTSTTLQASAFADINAQLDSQWQVCDDSNCTSTVVDVSGGATDTVTVTGLSAKTTYYWRVQYIDEAGLSSLWSVPTRFMTVK